jgi:hypothetical protein
MKRLILLSTLTVFGLFLLSGTVLAWTYQYECDDYPLFVGWEMSYAAAKEEDFEITTDPEDPTNNILHIKSKDGENVKMQYYWGEEPAEFTAEIRLKEPRGGLFIQAWLHGKTISLETKPPYDLFEWFTGPYGTGDTPAVEYIFLEEWNVFRLTYGLDGFMLYANGELAVDGTGHMGGDANSPGTDGASVIRFGHSSGSGPADGGQADIMLDYVYFDKTGAYAPGEEPWANSVESGSWAKIKALF